MDLILQLSKDAGAGDAFEALLVCPSFTRHGFFLLLLCAILRLGFLILGPLFFDLVGRIVPTVERVGVDPVAAGVAPVGAAPLSEPADVHALLLQLVDDRDFLGGVEAPERNGHLPDLLVPAAERERDSCVADAPPTEVLKFENRIVIVRRTAALARSGMQLQIGRQVGRALENVDECAGDLSRRRGVVVDDGPEEDRWRNALNVAELVTRAGGDRGIPLPGVTYGLGRQVYARRLWARLGLVCCAVGRALVGRRRFESDRLLVVDCHFHFDGIRDGRQSKRQRPLRRSAVRDQLAVDLFALRPSRAVFTIGQRQLADAMPHAVAELAEIDRSIRRCVLADAVHPAGDKVALVFVAILELEDAATIHLAIGPMAGIGQPGADGERAVSLRTAILEHTFEHAVGEASVVVGSAFGMPGQGPRAAGDRVGYSPGAATRLPEEIEVELGMRVPDPEDLPHQRTGRPAPDDLGPLFPGPLGGSNIMGWDNHDHGDGEWELGSALDEAHTEPSRMTGCAHDKEAAPAVCNVQRL